MGCPFRSLVPITPRVASLGYRAVLNDDVAPVSTGSVFFADMNWLVSENTADNRAACLALFDVFFSGEKNLQCAEYTGDLEIPYSDDAGTFGVGYVDAPPAPQGAYCPVLHNALDPEGYLFTPVDITQVDAHELVNKPFVMHLYSSSMVFSATVAENLLEISRKVPLVIFGEWQPWADYDNRVLAILGYLPEEVEYANSLVETDSVVNTDNALGLLLSQAGVVGFDHSATGTFQGSLAGNYAFATADDEPSMLVLPAR